MKRIYFDNASTTPVNKCVYKAMRPYLKDNYGNPSSIHKEGRKAKYAIEQARQTIANILHCNTNEIFFISNASEGNSWISKIYNLYYYDNVHDSIKLANDWKDCRDIFAFSLIDNETGRDNSFFLKSTKNYHIDLTQAIGKVNINLREHTNKCVSAVLSGHKFGAPKGIGCMFIRQDMQKDLVPLIFGHQEYGLRGGTENVAGIVGISKALEIAYKDMNKNNKRISEIIQYINSHIKPYVADVQFSHNIMNITFKRLNAQTAVQMLDRYGVAVSAGSACNSNNDEASNTLLFYGYTEDAAKRTIRVSIGTQNSTREAKKFCRILIKLIDTYDI